jgi:hypothetical protein
MSLIFRNKYRVTADPSLALGTGIGDEVKIEVAPSITLRTGVDPSLKLKTRGEGNGCAGSGGYLTVPV